MAKSYSDKLKDPRWQKKRLEILHSVEFKCESCGDTEEMLHVHHVYYEKDQDPWEYPDEAYMVLCSKCHEKWHNLKYGIDRALCKMDVETLLNVMGIVVQLKMMGPNATLIFYDLISGYHWRQIEKAEESKE